MPALSDTLRSKLEKTVIAARDAAEDAASAALESLAVARDEFFPGMSEEQKVLRRALRAKAAQLGEQPIKYGGIREGWDRLVEEIAYEQWHRMLFARTLAENDLLMHPEGVAVTLEECEELASEEGAVDGWELAARYAGEMLPGLFSQDDPATQVRFAPEGRRKLETLLMELPPAVFSADDSLGWVYQFWQSKKKNEVNRSERKIGGADLYPVTQLFTEDYMVQFLLQNSLGAWWAARHPDSPLIAEWDYLRWMDEVETPPQPSPPAGREPSTRLHSSPRPRGELEGGMRIPAAGTFPGWPDRAAGITMMDPCGGSGHFVVAGFEMLRRMRMQEEGLGEVEAADAVIRDNLFMLEIDPRCTQIATFALALAAWKAGGYRDLPTPNIACSGIPVEGQLEEWLRLAGDAPRLRTALERLHHLFKQAPTLGSLIDPADVPVQDRMFSADYHEVAPLLEEALARESERRDPAATVLGEAARGVLKAARLLAGQYTLVTTNVPYLLKGKQSDFLKNYCESHYPDSRSDLATVFIERITAFLESGGTHALVTPQNWLFLYSYMDLRKKMLTQQQWNGVATLGSGSQAKESWEKIRALTIVSKLQPTPYNIISGVEAPFPDDSTKAKWLRDGEILVVQQAAQPKNPDATVSLKQIAGGTLLSKYADSLQGIATADYSRFGRFFWERPAIGTDWAFQQSTTTTAKLFSGRESMVFWEEGSGLLASYPTAYIRGAVAWGRKGVAVTQTRNLPCTLYLGELFDNNTAVILPRDPDHLLPIWCFCSSEYFNKEVRKIDRKIGVTNSKFAKVPFDLNYWQSIAEEQYPDGLPDPWSNDPTQWLFKGHPVGSTEPLHVAVARLLGYRWPETPTPPQAGEGSVDDDLDQFADEDGIVCIPAVAGEQPAHERLRALLAHAYNRPPELPDFEKYRVGDYVPTTPVPPKAGWSAQTEQKLLAHTDAEGRDLAYWLHYKFFIQHCKLFGNRPFLWHIWDGRNDGFAAIVNYHKLDAHTLDKLIYTYLGTWIRDQRAAVAKGEPGADARLAAAQDLKQKLEAIRQGEPPFDIYVRWKALHEQPIGWDPDLNDGVRQNIRPFVEANVLRRKFSIRWTKDRGKNPDGSERINDLHFTRAQKMDARQRLS